MTHATTERTSVHSSGDPTTPSPHSGWQARLLPLMTRMLVGLTLFFFVASFAQLCYLQWKISHFTGSESEELSAVMLPVKEGSTEVGVEAHFNAALVLEARALRYRHQRADVLLMARVWARYLGFVTGMILSLVGATFILGRLADGGSDVSGKAAEVGFRVKTTSPGIVLAVLGTVLMLTTILSHHQIEVRDLPVYISPQPIGGVGAADAGRSAKDGDSPIIEIKPPTANSRSER